MKFDTKNQTHTTLNERISVARKSFGVSQIEMAKRLGIAASTYQGCESRRANPKASVLLGFAAMGISADWLLTGHGEMLRADRGQAPDGLGGDGGLLAYVVRRIAEAEAGRRRRIPPENRWKLYRYLCQVLEPQIERRRAAGEAAYDDAADAFLFDDSVVLFGAPPPLDEN